LTIPDEIRCGRQGILIAEQKDPMTAHDNNHPTALVTGAARRIGREIAMSLARRGFDVAIHYRSSRGEAEAVVAELRRVGVRACAVQADLADVGQLADLIPQVAATLAPPNCLINSASEFCDDTVATMTFETWSRHLDTNLKAPVFLTKALAQHLPLGSDGHVINIIDQRVLKPTPDFFSYTISKAGLWSATRTLAQALAPRIRVNAIGPGPILQSVHQTDAEFAAECAGTLLKRGSSPHEIAAAIGFLLDSPAITGQLIALDGGQHLA
jgi:NAD(P)-dependent dehydrogenase (short-subunit alcohol dehydrogenase family)